MDFVEKSQSDDDDCISTTTITSYQIEDSNIHSNDITAIDSIENSFNNSNINTKYYLLCNNCKDMKFKKLDDLMEHINSEHPTTSTADLDISMDSIGLRMDASDKAFQNISNNRGTNYNMKTLSRAALLDIITILSQCACLWHIPTRKCPDIPDLLCAYYLILMKLQKYEQEATFEDVKSIVKQLTKNINDIMYAAETQIETNEQQIEFMYGGELVTQTDDEGESPNCQLALEILSALISINEENINKNDMNKLCSLCHMNCLTYTDLWNHMKSAHISKDVLAMFMSRVEDIVEINDEKDVRTVTEASCSAASKNQNKVTNKRKYPSKQDNAKFWDDNLDKGNGYNMRPRKPKDTSYLKKKSAHYEETSCMSDVKIKPSTPYLKQYNDEFLIKFINSLKQKECLWNIRSVAYRDHQQKERAYEELMKEYRTMLPQKPQPNQTTIKNIIRRLKYYYKRLKSCKSKQTVTRHYIWQKLSFIEGEKNRLKTPSKSLKKVASTTGVIGCTKCSKKYKRIDFYNNHMMREHPITKCPQCHENFPNVDDLKAHVLWYHRKDIQCPMCTTKQQVNSNVDWKTNKHLAKHFPQYQCDYCDRIFHDFRIYTKHRMQCRHKRNNFVCSQCNSAGQLSQLSVRKNFIKQVGKKSFTYTKFCNSKTFCERF